MDYRSRTLSPEITGSGGNEDLSWLPVCLNIFRGGKTLFESIFCFFGVYGRIVVAGIQPIKKIFCI